MPKTFSDQGKDQENSNSFENLAANQLSRAISPYLLQHAENPVHWWEWGDAALELAQKQNKPILISIGYAACHWCHVMAHESFEDQETADLMNRYFINIKVDREERPDIDQIYMSALHSMGEQGGWPLTMFLTPKGEPFWGGTYFPLHRSHGRPSFKEVLMSIQKTYYEAPDNIEHNVFHVKQFLQRQNHADGEVGDILPPPDYVKQFSQDLLGLVDWQNGGIKGAPKFPNAPINEALFRGFKTQNNQQNGEAFIECVKSLSQGGIYDHLGGGLARYATDDRWLVPHFEKMLYDNAHFLRHLAWSFGETKDPLFAKRINETINWLIDEMQLQGGGFASSLDADSEGEEGKFYVWQWEEINEILAQDSQIFCQYYDITPNGNWEGKNILNRPLDSSLLADDLLESELKERIENCRLKLLAHRAKRIRPNLDDKLLIDWNSYLIRALVEAGLATDQPAYITLAKTTYEALVNLKQKGRLPHSFREGKGIFPCFSSDYAAMTHAALSLYEALQEQSYLTQAKSYIEILKNEYFDGEGGFFLTNHSAKDLVIRPRGDKDEANPSANSQILEALCRLNAFCPQNGYDKASEILAKNLYARLNRQGFGNAGFMNALDTYYNLKEILIIAKDEQSAKPFLKALWQKPEPNRVIRLILSRDQLAPYQKDMIKSLDKTPVILLQCQNQTCQLPITELGKI